MTASAFAPAKVNLYLHVGPLAADGFHPLQTLMVFADVGDEVSLASEPWPSLQVTGPFAGELGEGDNLVSRASDLLAARVGGARGGAGLRLDKRLPVAAGAVCLRALRTDDVDDFLAYRSDPEVDTVPQARSHA